MGGPAEVDEPPRACLPCDVARAQYAIRNRRQIATQATLMAVARTIGPYVLRRIGASSPCRARNADVIIGWARGVTAR